MLSRGHFVITFAEKEGAATALQQSPLNFGDHLLYLHPWRPQFNPAQPTGIRIPIWNRFPKLDDLYYRALPELCKEIGEVVWAGKEEDYLKKSSTPRLCILVEDISTLPSEVILPIPIVNGEVTITLEYEGLPLQCNRCLGVDHNSHNCKNKKNLMRDKEKVPTGDTRYNQPDQPRKNDNFPQNSKEQETERPTSTQAVNKGRTTKELSGEGNNPLPNNTGERMRQIVIHQPTQTKPTGQTWMPISSLSGLEIGGTEEAPASLSHKDRRSSIENPLDPVLEKEVCNMMARMANNAHTQPSNEVTTQEGEWQEVGRNNRVIKPIITTTGNIGTPQRPQTTPGRKRLLASTILTEAVWETLNTNDTPQIGEKRLQIWPVVYLAGTNTPKRYLSLLSGELEATKVSMIPMPNFTFAEVKQICWDQLQLALMRKIGGGAQTLTKRTWDSIQWVEQWQALLQGGAICHVLAVMDLDPADDHFYFNEATHKWTDAEFIRVLVNAD